MFEHNVKQRRIFEPEFDSQRDALLRVFEDAIERAQDKPGSRLLAEAEHLADLENVVLKFMLNEKIAKSDMETLSATEKSLFFEFLVKKKLIPADNRTVMDSPHKLVQVKETKRVEEHLKYIFKKAYKFLKKAFSSSIGERVLSLLKGEYRGRKDSREYCFFGFYFEECALKVDLRIENFFEPKVMSNRKNTARSAKRVKALKTISKLYISNLKMSKVFVAHFTRYLRRGLVREVRNEICVKTRRLIAEWNHSLVYNGRVKGLKAIEKSIRESSRNKIVWSVKDVSIGIDLVIRSFFD